MTPSEQAKQYAAEHGYTLTRVENLIIIKRDGHDIGTVSKYDRALRMMQSDQIASVEVESALFPEVAGEHLEAISDNLNVPAALLKSVADSESSSAIRSDTFARRSEATRKYSQNKPWRIVERGQDGKDRHHWDSFPNYAAAIKVLRRCYAGLKNIRIAYHPY